MKYEETVMKTPLEAVWDFEKFKLDQSEVSFKAGIEEAQRRLHSEEVRKITEEALAEQRLAGIKEVVDWGDEPCPHESSMVEILSDNDDVIGERLFSKRECYKCWQAKLKEWGIDG